MRLKLIKKEESGISRVRPVFYGDAGDQSEAPQAAAVAAEAAPEAAGREIDVALIEKTAFENGFREGEKAAAAEAEKRLQSALGRFSHSLDEVAGLKSALYRSAEREVVKLALETARKIVRREVRADPEIVETLVSVALGRVAVKSSVTVHLNPADQEFLARRRAAPPDGKTVEEVVLVPDASIERGGCLIRTECGDVDARLEEQFREVERSFFDREE